MNVDIASARIGLIPEHGLNVPVKVLDLLVSRKARDLATRLGDHECSIVGVKREMRGDLFIAPVAEYISVPVLMCKPYDIGNLHF